MKDLLQTYHTFATRICDVLNAANVEPCGDKESGDVCAVLIVVGNPAQGDPLGGGLNYNHEKKAWDVEMQLEAAIKVN